MKVLLAGYNIDADIIKDLKQKSNWGKDNVTPETLSAAYARISRDPREVPALREVSREEVEKARKSNETIIFGLGHSSVAEHAVFNFDVVGLSRLAVEEIQKFRLASFTEKSQRYITLESDFLVPEEIKEAGLEDEFRSVISEQNRSYDKLYTVLKDHLFEKHSEKLKEKFGERTVDGWAKEDARYAVSMATTSQFGMTVNARTLEHMLQKMRCSKLNEIRTLADKLHSLVSDMAPSIVKYTGATPCNVERPRILKEKVDSIVAEKKGSKKNRVELIDFTKKADATLAAAIIFDNSTLSFEESTKRAEELTEGELTDLIKTALSHRKFYDGVERCFESVEFNFDLTVSSSCYAQLKRHRMSTQIVQDYDTALGFTTPHTVREAGLENEFNEVMEKTESFYDILKEKLPNHKNYILTNAHRRRVMFKLNLRELYHFTALREDEHAQWEIREVAEEMRMAAQRVAPISTMMLCGKSNFAQTEKKIFGEEG